VKATTFTANSDTQVTATVPTGAVTGKIGITTLGRHSDQFRNLYGNAVRRIWFKKHLEKELSGEKIAQGVTSQMTLGFTSEANR